MKGRQSGRRLVALLVVTALAVAGSAAWLGSQRATASSGGSSETSAGGSGILRIGTTNQDGGVRADVWRFFDGESSVPAIVNPLVRALQADPDARAREEAAETLGNYFDDPIVESALQLAVESDGSERVRNKAKRTLAARRSIAPPAEPR